MYWPTWFNKLNTKERLRVLDAYISHEMYKIVGKYIIVDEIEEYMIYSKHTYSTLTTIQYAITKANTSDQRFDLLELKKKYLWNYKLITNILHYMN